MTKLYVLILQNVIVFSYLNKIITFSQESHANSIEQAPTFERY